jgi:hypothetical protein
MAPNRRIRLRSVSTAVAAIVVIVAVSGCVTQNHRATIDSINSSKPVSASAMYVTAEGGYVGPQEYEIVEHIEFTVDSIGSVTGDTENTISIDEEIGDAVARTDADAIVNFEFYAVEYDTGNLGYVIFTRIFGGMMAGVGFPLIFLEYTTDIGIGFTAVGGASLITSFILPSASESRWTLGFEGDAVRTVRPEP